MKLKSIEICGMHGVNATYDLHDIQYLYGSNGAGKTTILQAIQLAILGYIPGTDKTKTAIFSHSTENEMSVRLTTDNPDVHAFRQWGKTKTAITQLDDVSDVLLCEVKKLELPIFNFSQFMSMTANKLKDWFIDFLPTDAADLDWRTVLESAVPLVPEDEELLTMVLGMTNSCPKDVLGVRHVNELLKDELSYEKGQQVRHQKTVENLVYYDIEEDNGDLHSMNEALEKIRLHLCKLRQELDSRNKMESMLSMIQGHESYCRGYDIENARRRLTSKQQEAEELNSFIQVNESKLVEMLSDIGTMKQTLASGGVCKYTFETCQSIVETFPDIQRRLEDMIMEESKQRSRLKIQKERLNEVQSDIGQLVSEMHSYELHNSECDRLRKIVSNDMNTREQTVIESEIHKSENEIEALVSGIAKLEANQRYISMKDEIVKQKYRSERRISVLKEWVKLTDVNGLQSSLMLAPFRKLESAMNNMIRYMFQGDVSATFYITEKANSFSFGITREGQFIPFELLSSGERCMFTFALLIEIIKMASTDMPVLIVDDMLDHLDDANAEKIFNVIKQESDVQIIMAGVKPCSLEYVVEVLHG